jgi:cobalt-zinc-cadmium efflux system membrane fusion protein
MKTPANVTMPFGRHLLACLALLGAAAQAATPAAAGRTVKLSPAQVQAMGVSVQTVSATAASMGPYAGTVSLPPARLRRVAAPWPGLVAQLQVSEGDTVKAGQVLATLLSPNGVEQSNAARAARGQQELSQQNLQRDEALFKEGLIPRSRLEASRSQARQDELATQSRQAVAQTPDARWEGGRLQILAPLSGVVLGRTVTLGERVEAGAQLMHIGQPGGWWVDVRVPVGDAAQIQPGQAVMLGEGVAVSQATVSAVGMAVDAATQTVLVRAQVAGAPKQAGPSLRWGQAVSVQVQQGAGATVGLPDAAIVEWQGEPAVWLQEAEGSFRLASVQQAQRKAGQSTVQGLPPGARVVVRGTAALKALLDARP